MQFPYKIYQARNPSNPAYVYLGKASIAGYYGAQSSFFPHLVEKDCQDLFVFASIIGGKNIKITAPTETDPYIYIDTRWTYFNKSADTSASYSFLKDTTTDRNFTLKADFRTITSDGSLLIKSGANSKFFWNGVENVEDPDLQINECVNENITQEDGQIIIKRYDYSLVDNPITKPFWDKKSVSLIDKKVVDQDNYKVLLQLKSIVGSECIKVEDTSRGTIKISFNKANCPCGCFDFDTSQSSSSSSIEVCAGLSSVCISSSSRSSQSSQSSRSSPSSNSSSSSSSSSSSRSSPSSQSSTSSSSSVSSVSSTSSSSVSSNSSSSSSFDERCEPFVFANTAVQNSLFGGSVAVTEDGEFLAVGAPQEKAVYIYQTPVVLPTGLPGYNQICKITSTDKDFGWSVDFSSNNEWLVIGAPGYNNDQGRVHVFSKTAIGGNWALATTATQILSGTGTLQKLLTPNSKGHRFGHSVSINNGASVGSATVLVGCPWFTSNPNIYGINAGAAFSYMYSGGPWVEERIIPSDAEQQDYFGWDVSLTSDGLNAVIGSIGDDDNGIDSGSAYVYNYTGTWSNIYKAKASDGQQDDNYGHSVAIGDNSGVLHVAIGSPNHNGEVGAVYMYNNSSGWSEQKITAINPISEERYGFDLSMNGCGSIVIASSVPRNYSYEPYSGFARVLTRLSSTVWAGEELMFVGLNPDDGYGYAVDITETGSHVGISAPYDNSKVGYVRLISLESDCYNWLVPCNGEERSSSSSKSSDSSTSSSSSSSNSSSSSSSNSSSSSSYMENFGVVVGSGTPGNSYWSLGTWFIDGGGDGDIGGANSRMHFRFMEVSGDYTLTARVSTVTTLGDWRKGGIMFRDSLLTNAQEYGILVTNQGSGAYTKFVTSQRGGSGGGFGPDIGSMPFWIRIARVGNLFSSYYSLNGLSWTLFETVNIAMPSNILVGLAATNLFNGSSSNFTFDNVYPPLGTQP